MKTKTYDYKKNAKYRLIMGLIFFIIGIILNITKPEQAVIGTLTFANWLMLTGVVLVVIGVRNHFYGRILKIDERYQKIINKASSTTFATIIYLCFTMFIIGMVKPIQIELSIAASWVLFTIIIVYRISLWYYNKKY